MNKMSLTESFNHTKHAPLYTIKQNEIEIIQWRLLDYLFIGTKLSVEHQHTDPVLRDCSEKSSTSIWVTAFFQSAAIEVEGGNPCRIKSCQRQFFLFFSPFCEDSQSRKVDRQFKNLKKGNLVEEWKAFWDWSQKLGWAQRWNKML